MAATDRPAADGSTRARTARSKAAVRRAATSPPRTRTSGSASNASRADRSASTARDGSRASDGVGTHLPGSNPVGLLHRQHEDLAVADLAGPGRLEDGVDDAVDLAV